MEMKTFPRVMELLKEQLRRTGSVNAIVKKTGLTHNTVGNYLEGRAEPTQASLEKLGKAYGRSPAWLRGDTDVNTPPEGSIEVIDIATLSPSKRQLWDVLNKIEDEKVEGVLALLQKLLPVEKTK
jgi:transcriptional regulator with XRE-family HTH domain